MIMADNVFSFSKYIFKWNFYSHLLFLWTDMVIIRFLRSNSIWHKHWFNTVCYEPTTLLSVWYISYWGSSKSQKWSFCSARSHWRCSKDELRKIPLLWYLREHRCVQIGYFFLLNSSTIWPKILNSFIHIQYQHSTYYFLLFFHLFMWMVF